MGGKTAYFDCVSGISGDMFLGALVDAGLPVERLSAALEALGIEGLAVEAEKVQRLGMAATKVSVIAPPEQSHRHLGQIEDIIERSSLSEAVKATAGRIFRRLGEAEAKVHGGPLEKVHFHEVGALDSIADIVGAAAGLELLGIEKCYFSPVPTGSGTVKSAHGILPVPAPATAELLTGVPLRKSRETGELTTPTGAAIARELAEAFGGVPAMTIESVGSGAGNREGEFTPNILRVLVGQESRESSAREVVVIEAAVDDMTGEAISYAVDALFEAGALDAYVTAIMMKKGRPGHLITVLAKEAAKDKVLEALFEETTTFGARLDRREREILDRETVELDSQYGAFRVKVGAFRGKVVSATPEYEDARRIALETKTAFRTVYARLQAEADKFRRKAAEGS